MKVASDSWWLRCPDLAGAGSYGSIGERELRARLNYETDSAAAGKSHSDADDNDDVIVHPAYG